MTGTKKLGIQEQKFPKSWFWIISEIVPMCIKPAFLQTAGETKDVSVWWAEFRSLATQHFLWFRFPSVLQLPGWRGKKWPGSLGHSCNKTFTAAFSYFFLPLKIKNILLQGRSIKYKILWIWQNMTVFVLVFGLVGNCLWKLTAVSISYSYLACFINVFALYECNKHS